MAKSSQGGRRRGAGRPLGPLGKGIKSAIMIPEQLRDAILQDAAAAEITFSQAAIARLVRGKRQGQAL